MLPKWISQKIKNLRWKEGLSSLHSFFEKLSKIPEYNKTRTDNDGFDSLAASVNRSPVNMVYSIGSQTTLHSFYKTSPTKKDFVRSLEKIEKSAEKSVEKSYPSETLVSPQLRFLENREPAETEAGKRKSISSPIQQNIDNKKAKSDVEPNSTSLGCKSCGTILVTVSKRIDNDLILATKPHFIKCFSKSDSATHKVLVFRLSSEYVAPQKINQGQSLWVPPISNFFIFQKNSL